MSRRPPRSRLKRISAKIPDIERARSQAHVVEEKRFKGVQAGVKLRGKSELRSFSAGFGGRFRGFSPLSAGFPREAAGVRRVPGEDRLAQRAGASQSRETLRRRVRDVARLVREDGRHSVVMPIQTRDAADVDVYDALRPAPPCSTAAAERGAPPVGRFSPQARSKPWIRCAGFRRSLSPASGSRSSSGVDSLSSSSASPRHSPVVRPAILRRVFFRVRIQGYAPRAALHPSDLKHLPNRLGGRKHEKKRMKARRLVGESTKSMPVMLHRSKPLPRRRKPESP